MIESMVLRRNHPVDNAELNALRAGSWDGGQGGHDWLAVLRHSLGWITAHHGDRLVGFVNVAWDGGDHAFLLDTTTARDLQRQGIGSRLVGEAIELARSAGCEWLHVDSDADLMERFYEPCGFRPTPAGLVNLRQALDPDGVERSDRPPRLAVHVRAESDPDRDGVDALYRAVGGDMGELMTRLRLAPELVRPMTLVAVADNVVVGHIAFSHGTLQVGERSRELLSLGPLAVMPSHQGRGVGSALVRIGLALAEAALEPCVVLWGHTTYYPRFGFEPAAPLGILPSGNPSPAWMVRRLSSYNPRIRGRFSYCAAFDGS